MSSDQEDLSYPHLCLGDNVLSSHVERFFQGRALQQMSRSDKILYYDLTTPVERMVFVSFRGFTIGFHMNFAFHVFQICVLNFYKK